MASDLGFRTAFTPDQIPVDKKYRKSCGRIFAGTMERILPVRRIAGVLEEMHQQLLSADLALILQSEWEIPSDRTAGTTVFKVSHNASIHYLRVKLRRAGLDVFAAGYGGCTLCKPCKRKENKPCTFPAFRICSVSAYCIDVAMLAERCGLPFDWNPQKLYLFGMILFR